MCVCKQFKGELQVHFAKPTNAKPFPPLTGCTVEDSYPEYPSPMPKEPEMPKKSWSYVHLLWLFIIAIVVGIIIKRRG